VVFCSQCKCNFSVICSALFPNETAAVGIHHVFLPAIEAQCSDEQKTMWLKRARNCEIIGTYAQTEIGHGKFYDTFSFRYSKLTLCISTA